MAPQARLREAVFSIQDERRSRGQWFRDFLWEAKFPRIAEKHPPDEWGKKNFKQEELFHNAQRSADLHTFTENLSNFLDSTWFPLNAMVHDGAPLDAVVKFMRDQKLFESAKVVKMGGLDALKLSLEGRPVGRARGQDLQVVSVGHPTKPRRRIMKKSSSFLSSPSRSRSPRHRTDRLRHGAS